MSNIAVIPARGGSTRLKNKNILRLGDTPLISWTIEAVINSQCFDRIIVSSDSNNILEIAKEYSVELYKRPQEFATKEAKVLDTMLHLLFEIDKCDTFSYFLPTCPFRNENHIKEAFALLYNADSVVSVKKYSEPIQLAGAIENGLFIPKTNDLCNGNTNSLFMEEYYLPNGGIYMSKSKPLKKYRNFFKGRCAAYVMDKKSSIDINDSIDFRFAQEVLHL